MPYRFVLTLLILSSPIATFASDNCSHKDWRWKVDKNAAFDLQQFVNQGHEPWRMDGTAAIAEEAIDDRKKDWADVNTVLEAPQIISETRNTALLIAKSGDGSVRYKVTLRKYSWLLHSAKNNWSWIIWIPEAVERIECPVQR